MKNIVAAFDGLRFSENTLQYALWLAGQEGAQITAVFLSESTRLGYEIYLSLVGESAPGEKIVEQVHKEDAALLDEAVNQFEAACRNAKIPYHVHRDSKNAIKELIQESVFADVLIIEAEETFSYIDTDLPGSFIKDVLHRAECPVIIVPRKFTPVNKFIFLYDGQSSSVFAMKMFAYTMPATRGDNVEIVYAKESNESMQLPNNKRVREWLKAHFPRAVVRVLKGGEVGLTNILSKEDSGIMIVTGAYDRSVASMLFHSSVADKLMRKIEAPIFIAHS